MDPDRLLSLLGPSANVPWERAVVICAAFNRELERFIMGREHKYHRTSAVPEPELGTREWKELRAC